jgi:response regulator NasT
MTQAIGRLRVAIAEDERDTREFFAQMVSGLGHEVVGTAQTGRELAALCRAQRPDLVITDIKMPDMDGIETSTAINQERQMPVILVSGHHDAELIARAAADHIMAYLVKPVKPPDLEAAIYLAVLRFEQFQKLSREASGLRQALEDRKVIERAKGILMKRGRLDEAEAFRRLQRLASDKNRKLVEIAELVLTVEEAFQ